MEKSQENKSPEKKSSEKKSSEKKIKCQVCKKKCGMIHFTCRCGDIFCVKHQLPHSHNCQFDNQVRIQKELQTNNPKIEHSKLIKI